MRSDRSSPRLLARGRACCPAAQSRSCQVPWCPCPKAEWGHSGMQLLPGLWRECPREGAFPGALRLRGPGSLEALSCKWLPLPT